MTNIVTTPAEAIAGIDSVTKLHRIARDLHDNRGSETSGELLDMTSNLLAQFDRQLLAS